MREAALERLLGGLVYGKEGCRAVGDVYQT